jgi:hypothetical protein
MALPSFLEPPPPPRYRKYIIIGVWTLVGVVAIGLTLFFLLRFHSEESTVRKFMDDVVAGNFQAAYGMWSKESNYSFSDFMQDWGTGGYYGPVHSYEIVASHEPSDASGVIVLVYVSPFRPFPSESDIEKGRQTKQVRLWVQFSDHSISYAP